MHLYYITTPDGTASVVARNLHEAYALAYATYSDVGSSTNLVTDASASVLLLRITFKNHYI